MEDKASKIAHLIHAYINKELSEQEAVELQQWVDDSEENREFFGECINPELLFNELTAYNKAGKDSESVLKTVFEKLKIEFPMQNKGKN